MDILEGQKVEIVLSKEKLTEVELDQKQMALSIESLIKKQARKIVKLEIEEGLFDKAAKKQIEKSHSRLLNQQLRQLKDLQKHIKISEQRLVAVRRSQAGMNDAVSANSCCSFSSVFHPRLRQSDFREYRQVHPVSLGYYCLPAL